MLSAHGWTGVAGRQKRGWGDCKAAQGWGVGRATLVRGVVSRISARGLVNGEGIFCKGE